MDITLQAAAAAGAGLGTAAGRPDLPAPGDRARPDRPGRGSAPRPRRAVQGDLPPAAVAASARRALGRGAAAVGSSRRPPAAHPRRLVDRRRPGGAGRSRPAAWSRCGWARVARSGPGGRASVGSRLPGHDRPASCATPRRRAPPRATTAPRSCSGCGPSWRPARSAASSRRTPGRTADELAAQAGARFPGHAADLAAAARLFDQIRYGGGAGTRDGYERLCALDAALAGTALPDRPGAAGAGMRERG